ncbi:MAG TPA: S8 family serine peptidase, partial [Longimicrobiaceae bacterium]|nr:S8 family serine peptidase [Longimicrobiaceae bacterium]
DDAIRKSILSGVTYVLAAGNDNMDACYFSPARTLEAITVGATTSSDVRSYFSNWGSCVDIFAPGSAITSAWYSSDTALRTIDGTSMAAPHVAGVAALYLQGDPGATPATVASAILNSATRGWIANVGGGSPNLFLYSPLTVEAPAPLIELSQTVLEFSVAPASTGSSTLAGPAPATGPGTSPLGSAMAVRAAAARVVGSGAGPRKEGDAPAATGAAMDVNAAATASKPVSLKNAGTATLNWTGSSNRSWLTLSSTGGSLAPGQSTTLTVTVNGAGLAAGTHVGTITITGPGAANPSRIISVTLTVVPATVIRSGVPVTGLSGASGSQVWYMINVPAGATKLTVTISGAGGTGDADLYVDRENAPSLSRWSCRPYYGGNNETCAFTGPNPGTWYVMLHGYSSYSAVSLTATVTMPGRLAWQNTGTGERSIWHMNGTTYSGQSTVLQTAPVAWQIAASADFDADGDHDLVWQNTSTGQRSIWIMNGTTWTGVYKMLPTLATQWDVAGAADMTADGCPELVLQNRTTGERSIWIMNCSAYTVASQVGLPQMATAWDIGAVSDLTCDGKPDLAWQNTSSGEHMIWHMNGIAYSGQSSALPTAPVAWQIAGAADLTEDGKNDLVWQNTSTGQRSIWHMECAGWPGQYTLLPTMPVAWQIAAAYRG